jgi:serine/threonine protein kinase
MDLPRGARFGPYEIVAPIAAGGMGEVYRGRDTRLEREVAVKVLPREVATDPERVRRFQQEARAAGVLNHPNVTALYDVGTHDGAPYVVSELLEGQTLRQRIDEGPIPPRKALEYGVQIAHGLAAAHEKGIVHRDLKPENVFVTRDGRVKILDFGLAKLTEADGDPAEPGTSATQGRSAPGIVLGTAAYMSPEQVRGRPADARSDIFALGAILYEMLCGRRAFRGASAVDTMSAVLREDPPELSLSGGAVPREMERIVQRGRVGERPRPPPRRRPRLGVGGLDRRRAARRPRRGGARGHAEPGLAALVQAPHVPARRHHGGPLRPRRPHGRLRRAVGWAAGRDLLRPVGEPRVAAAGPGACAAALGLLDG